jgi:hypothetical protein
MFLRFAAAIGLLTAISLAAIAVEKQNLSLKRIISLQHYQFELLREKRSRQILQAERFGGPLNLLQATELQTDGNGDRASTTRTARSAGSSASAARRAR